MVMKMNFIQKTRRQKTGYALFSFFMSFLLLLSFSGKATDYYFNNTFSGAQSTPPNASTGSGIITGVYDDVTNTITYAIVFSGLSANSTVAHFHAPAPPGSSAPVVLPFVGFPAGVTSGVYTHQDVLSDQLEAWLLSGQVYANIHTTAFPAGEIRAQVTVTALTPVQYPFGGLYQGAQQVPPNNSPGIGLVTGILNGNTNEINYTIYFANLTTGVTAAHFHAPAPPGSNAPVVIPHANFPLGVTSGMYTHTDILTDAQKTQFKNDLFYANIHTSTYPGGEIRAQVIVNHAGACTPPTFLNDPTIVLDASCTGSDGNISIIPKSGTAPFMYSIDGGATYVSGADAGHTFQNLAPGTYQLRLKDSYGCESAIVSREVKRVYGGPTFLNDNTIVLNASCNKNDGNISIIPTCGAAPFMYSIDGGATYVAGPNGGYTFMGLAPGMYQLRLKDANGNQSAVIAREVKANAFGPCATLSAINPRLSSSALDQALQLRAYPNPSHGQFQVQLGGSGLGKLQVQILDSRGSVIEQRSLTAKEGTTFPVNLQGKAKGIYLVRVISDKGVQIQKVQVQ